MGELYWSASPFCQKRHALELLEIHLTQAIASGGGVASSLLPILSFFRLSRLSFCCRDMGVLVGEGTELWNRLPRLVVLDLRGDLATMHLNFMLL